MALLRTVVALSLLLLGHIASVQAQPSRDFPAFWSAFAGAVREGDGEKVAALTSFPLAAHGQTDSDRIRRLSKAQFLKAFPTILEQDSGMSAAPEPMRSYVARIDPVAILAKSGGGSVQVGAFRFEQRGGAWRLVRIYEDR